MNLNKKNNVLLTGATGLLGSRLLKTLLERSDCQINLLIRGLNYEESICRVSKLLKTIVGCHFSLSDSNCISRIRVFRSDLSKIDLGLNREEVKYLVENVNQIYHCAALTSFSESLDEVRKVNLTGTRNIFEFAKRMENLDCVEYISTVFVAGDYIGIFSENDLNQNQGFNNYYEQSKHEAENLILDRYYNCKFIVRIYRPGVIVGDYPDGKVLNPGLLYKLFRVLLKQTLSCIPINNTAHLNSIPANIAASIIYIIASRNKVCRTYHVLMPNWIEIKLMVATICSLFKLDEPKMVTLNEFEKMGFSSVVKSFLAPFMPYFGFQALIDSNLTFSELKDAGFYFPVLDEEYFYNLFDYYRCNYFNNITQD